VKRRRDTAELKTKKTGASVKDFLNSVPNERKRKDSFAVLKLMQEVTGTRPAMWGPSIVGFGKYHYKYASGHEGDMPLAGFSPRKQALTLYITAGFDGYGELLGKLGKFKTGKACLYINKLEDVDLATLKEMVRRSVEHMARKYAGP
jgi:hypothetical protein